MVFDDLFWRIIWLHRHGEVVVAYRQNPVFIKGLAWYFAVTIQAQQCYNIQDFPIPKFSSITCSLIFLGKGIYIEYVQRHSTMLVRN